MKNIINTDDLLNLINGRTALIAGKEFRASIDLKKIYFGLIARMSVLNIPVPDGKITHQEITKINFYITKCPTCSQPYVEKIGTPSVKKCYCPIKIKINQTKKLAN